MIGYAIPIFVRLDFIFKSMLYTPSVIKMDEKNSMEVEDVNEIEEVEAIIKEPLAGQISLFDLLAEIRC